jgi:G:T-mismatch repair DNA endonuclease (very short patch repair protein)
MGAGQFVEADARNLENIEALGWSCLMLWSCEIKDNADTLRVLREYLRTMKIR